MNVKGEFKVTNVETTFSSTGTELWRVTSLKPDGTNHCHVFPKTTMESRAAEYGIDPSDVDTLLDIVLHEPYMVDPTNPRYDATDDPAIKAGLMGTAKRFKHNMLTGAVVRPGDQIAAHCFNTDETTARQAHLLRVEACKRDRVKIVDPDGKLNAIRSDNRIDAKRVQAYKRQIQAIRNDEPEAAPSSESNTTEVKRITLERIDRRNGRIN